METDYEGKVTMMTYMKVREAAARWQITERRITMLCRDGRISSAKKEGKSWLIPADAPKPLDGRTREAEQRNQREQNAAAVIMPERADQAAAGVFAKTYLKQPPHVAFTPYRICLLGAHCDHQLGKITGFAVDKGIYIAYGPKHNGVVEIASLQFPKRAQWHVNSTPQQRENDWADHLRGATIALQKRYPLRTGLCAIINGELPIGGLSSSAAVTITFLSALSDVNGIKLSEAEMIAISSEAEKEYVGGFSGKLGQCCEIYCRKDHLLYMDMHDDSYELIPAHPDMKPYEFAIFFSGSTPGSQTAEFNKRIDECRSAAYVLKGYAGMEYGTFAQTNLREVPFEVYLNYKERLPQNWAKRAEHWYAEYHRVLAGVEAWRNGDLAEFGRLAFESGYSSIHNWETGSPEMKKLYEILTQTPGVYGGRFYGSGFKGCCIALIDPACEAQILAAVEQKYLAAFPALRGKYSAHICHSADGVHLA